MTQMNLSETETDSEGVGGGMEWEVGVSRCKLLYIEWLKQQGPTVEHRELYSISYDKP